MSDSPSDVKRSYGADQITALRTEKVIWHERLQEKR